jgi:uncharacterized integral membrane protein (TIGR00698 family)
MLREEHYTASSLDSLEGVPDPVEAPVAKASLLATARKLAPGLSIVVLVSMAAAWLADHYTVPILLFALLLGMAMNFLRADASYRPGLDFATRQLLRLGVALLGARITADQVLSLGGNVVLVVTLGVALTITAGWLLSRVLKLRPEFGVLTAGAVAICGASAALAISSVLPPSPTRERDTLLTVVGVTALSTVAMVTYPVLAAALGLSEQQTGLLLGATIHDVAQVVGAGYGVSKEVGDTATIVKLFRVALLLPVIVIVALMFRAKSETKTSWRSAPLVPGFLLAFIALVAINSTGLVPKELPAAAGEVSRWLLVAAIAAVGVKTSLGDMFKVGWNSLAIIVLETLVILTFALTAIQLM